MKHTVKWGIIGLGNIAFEFANSFYNADNAELIAVASKSHQKLINFKEKFNINNENLYNDYDRILENPNIDIFYLALPNSLHFDWAMKIINLKRNILVEKPAFMTIKDAEIIFNNKNFKNIFCGEGYMYKYHSQIKETIKVIKDGTIGKLKKMESSFGNELIYKKNFLGFKKIKIDRNKRLFNKDLGGGVILDQGCYTTSLSLLIASLVENIDLSNFKINNIQTEYLNSNIDVHSEANINFDDKFHSYVMASFKDNIGNKTKIEGEDGQIILENSWTSEKSKMQILGKMNKVLEFNDQKNLYSLEIKHISEDIISDKKEATFPGTNKKDILLNTRLIDKWING